MQGHAQVTEEDDKRLQNASRETVAIFDGRK